MARVLKCFKKYTDQFQLTVKCHMYAATRSPILKYFGNFNIRCGETSKTHFYFFVLSFTYLVEKGAICRH